MNTTVARSRWSLPWLDSGERLLLVTLALLTIGAWALTVQQSRSMDMPMGIVARGGAGPVTEADETEGADDMAGMPGMPMDDDTGGEGAGTLASSGMAAMGNGGWSWDGFATFLVAWTVMMAAMMFPAAAPMLALYRSIAAGRQRRGQAFAPTWVFAAGYLLVWSAAGVATWMAVQGLSDLAGRIETADRATWAPLALGGVLIIAGIYQFTPLKEICLRQCQSPIGFVMTRWRDGYRGALRMGLLHGGFCFGCCWALFAVLVAAGVMSLAWMLLLTLVVFAEKVLPLGRRAPQAIGAAFLILGGVVAFGAIDMPWMA